MMHRGRTLRRRDDNGAAAVEFALVMPLLLLLVFGIISYGMMLSLRQTLSQATTEGARAAAVTLVDANKATEGRAAVNDALDSTDVTCVGSVLKNGATTVGSCSIGAAAPCTAGHPTPTCVTVTLTYNYKDHPLVPSLGLGVVLPDKLSYSATARVS
jgi:Flp pilus assembly protein TadG